MIGKIFEAPEFVEITGPLIFLAGPIQGAPQWHHDAIAIIRRLDRRVSIASPYRHKEPEGEFTEKMFNEQVDWETEYLNCAAQNGVILFWLAKEAKHSCKRAYAQTSRFELGEWKERTVRLSGTLIVGIEEGFTGARYILRRFMQDRPHVVIVNNLDELCHRAVHAVQFMDWSHK
ncbi:MAG: hypothetical protein A2945_01525 [Candidatus Liptonbacteria bacterium RIFCSPLOWO2_01_FULL_52_25]|uniref:Nucleoside 2-deoxyribosyltransferase n=1 Tax=Candidatus Liptonbacteria bacterium RIFCSPLOWO2_01_FULL_52_25 TaxID=1798650 RepID=A0A1G2CFJ4_9BACT|nr:MAG: hypothetical protein A2945_01525 [Candidatus Liptonbacteria bacterium RIFCSPLOWO2_01_FULL_52_25]